MKILIGYEGASAGDAALAELKRAGLPSRGEATVLTVADLWPSAEEAPPPALTRAFPYVAKSHARAKKLLAETLAVARRAATRVRAILPGWRVTAESVADSPAWALFKKARDAGSDLVVVGCRPKSGLSRWGFGSVSHKVLTECSCSVRIARPRTRVAGPYRILLAVDGSPDAECALAQVLARDWPTNTMVRVVAVAEDRLRDAPRNVPVLKRWARHADSDPNAWLGRYVESVERQLLKNNLVVSGRVYMGDPKSVLVEKSSRWRADVVFLGARGLSRWERVVLGSVSSAVAVRASCTVEVVRPSRRVKGDSRA